MWFVPFGETLAGLPLLRSIRALGLPALFLWRGAEADRMPRHILAVIAVDMVPLLCLQL